MKRLLIGVSAVATTSVLSGCFATQADIRVLQGDLMLVRNEAAVADSQRKAQLDQVLRVVRQLNDSLAAVNNRLVRFRSDMVGSMSSVEQQLLQVQELTGQSQRRLQEVRASLEERQAQAAAIPPAGAPPGAATGEVMPGPLELYKVAREQFNQGSYGAARTAFGEILAKYPKVDVAPDAQYYIGDSYAAEGNSKAADSVYAKVVEKYPKSPQAPMALLKRATIAATQGKTEAARRLFNEVINKYGRSDEADLAKERLKALGRDE